MENNPIEYQTLTDPDQRDLMAERARKMVEQIKEGGYTNLVFLDKSARPIQTLLRDTWKREYGQTPFPLTNFVNIGTEITDKFEKDSEKTGFFSEDFEKYLTPEKVEQVIGRNEMDRLRNDYKYLSDAPDGSQILIIDEYSATGNSLIAVKKILEAIFGRNDAAGIGSIYFDTAAFASADSDTLFATSKPGKRKAPWSVGEFDKRYGITGIVDNATERLIASKMDIPHRIAKINELIIEHEHDRKKALEVLTHEEAGRSAWDKIVDEVQELSDLDLMSAENSNGETANQKRIRELVNDYFVTEIRPAAKRLLGAIAPLAENFKASKSLTPEEQLPTDLLNEFTTALDALNKTIDKMRTNGWQGSIFDTIESEIGVELPWKDREPLEDFVFSIKKRVYQCKFNSKEVKALASIVPNRNSIQYLQDLRSTTQKETDIDRQKRVNQLRAEIKSIVK